MGTDSIRQSLTKTDMISTIRLMSSADITRRQVYLVVEGQDDIKLLKKIVSENVCLCESYSGKIGVEEIVNNYFRNYARVVGIRDKDYEEQQLGKKIFFYDCSCMELMLSNCNETFMQVCCEYIPHIADYCSFRSHILLELRLISMIRMMNEIKQWELNLRGISIPSAYINDLDAIDNNKIVTQIKAINQSKLSVKEIDFEKIVEESQKMAEYLYLVNTTQGHDFCTLFATICNKTYQSHVNNKRIEEGLRCGYRMSDFIKTQLYEILLTYEKENTIFIVTSK